MSFYSELKRRNVLRVAAGYIVSAWLIIQVADTLLPVFGLPGAGMRIIVVVLAIGFIPALVTSWAFELTRQGWRREADLDHDGIDSVRDARRLDRIIMVILALGIAYFSFDKFVLSESREMQIAEARRDMDENISIAVLPFGDRSAGQPEQWFADGITQDILSILDKLEGLNAIDWESTREFRGSNADTRQIRETLSADYSLEGEIRRGDNDIEVTARLKDTRTGLLVNPFEYRLPLVGIFDIQEQLAQAVASALSISLDIPGRDILPGTHTRNVEAYTLFLEARSTRRFDQAEALLLRALELDPNYTDAWMARADRYGGQRSWDTPPAEARVIQEKGRTFTDKAIEIDPNLATAYSQLAKWQWAAGDWIEATRTYEQYSSMAPADIPARLGNSNILSKTGRLKEALPIDELAVRLNPLSWDRLTRIAELHIQLEQFDEADAVLDRMTRLNSRPDQSIALRKLLISLSKRDHAMIRKTLGEYAEAHDNYASANALPTITPLIEKILKSFDAPEALFLDDLRRIHEEDQDGIPEGRLIVAALSAIHDDAEFALSVIGPEVSGNLVRVSRLWYPFFSDMRQLQGFNELAEKIGFVDYWRTYGWADTCRPLTDDNFECW